MGETHTSTTRGGRPSRTLTGERKREQILDASVQVFGTGGAAAVTHRAVAKVARVPLGSTTYYFTDRNDLLLQTMAHARSAEAIRLAAIVEALDGELTVDRSVEVLTEMFFDKTVADPLYDLALFEMFMEATRNVTVRDEAREWSTMIGFLVDRVLPASDPTVPRATVVQIVACLVDGLMLEAVSNGELTVADLAERLKIVVERLCVQP
ncbi:TetR/AcrR family transcriptional regulator [Pengzhenrongella frigida]|uniref:TetR family transcriptional regulator n=1 Tax=Pengzhenrongella frigida TaxID=1259133 RepID=A0A4Q5MVB3_9MICO|nr:TetR/AcrR family transcriptional regulator [Cellulomonas sp. HLT2-17]RYV49532.1 TetR family transcriptional regulator [Cellulomonas sp. HLT2-17]